MADKLGYAPVNGLEMYYEIQLDHPARARKAVLASLGHTHDAMQPGMSGGMDALQPEMLHGSPFHDEYVALAPRPEDFPRLVERINGDLEGPPRARLAVLPATAHTGVPARGGWLAPMINEFLDAPE